MYVTSAENFATEVSHVPQVRFIEPSHSQDMQGPRKSASPVCLSVTERHSTINSTPVNLVLPSFLRYCGLASFDRQAKRMVLFLIATCRR